MTGQEPVRLPAEFDVVGGIAAVLRHHGHDVEFAKWATLDDRLTTEESAAAAATQTDDTECVCTHPRSDHGDGVVHTACCGSIEVPAPANPFGREQLDVPCECNGFEAR